MPRHLTPPPPVHPARRAARALAALAALAVVACGGGSDDGASTGCAITYAGGAGESVWCDTPVVRANGSGGYVLWVMAFRGPPGLEAEQAGQLTLSLDARPEVGVDYGFVGDVLGADVDTGFMTRTAASRTTHEADTIGGVGALTVRFSSLPATDGPDPQGWEGIGPVHGTITATLVPVSGGSDVTATGSF